jgi:hypothetical protein
MLMEFTLQPSGGYEAAHFARMRLDVSRTAQARIWHTDGPNTTLVKSLDLPAWLDVANDDTGSGDEDNVPRNNHIYSADTPSTAWQYETPGLGPPLAPHDRVQIRMNALEFVRIILGADPTDTYGNGVHGSRASEFGQWYTRTDVNKGAERYIRNNAVAGENDIGPGNKPLGEP